MLSCCGAIVIVTSFDVCQVKQPSNPKVDGEQRYSSDPEWSSDNPKAHSSHLKSATSGHQGSMGKSRFVDLS